MSSSRHGQGWDPGLQGEPQDHDEAKQRYLEKKNAEKKSSEQAKEAKASRMNPILNEMFTTKFTSKYQQTNEDSEEETADDAAEQQQQQDGVSYTEETIDDNEQADTVSYIEETINEEAETVSYIEETVNDEEEAEAVSYIEETVNDEEEAEAVSYIEETVNDEEEAEAVSYIEETVNEEAENEEVSYVEETVTDPLTNVVVGQAMVRPPDSPLTVPTTTRSPTLLASRPRTSWGFPVRKPAIGTPSHKSPMVRPPDSPLTVPTTTRSTTRLASSPRTSWGFPVRKPAMGTPSHKSPPPPSPQQQQEQHEFEQEEVVEPKFWKPQSPPWNPPRPNVPIVELEQEEVVEQKFWTPQSPPWKPQSPPWNPPRPNVPTIDEADVASDESLSIENNNQLVLSRRSGVESSDRFADDAEEEVGIENLGMSCFANATVQCLYGLSPIKEAVFAVDQDTASPISKELYTVLQTLEDRRVESTDLSRIFDALSMTDKSSTFNVNEQSDAREFLNSLLESVVDNKLPGKGESIKLQTVEDTYQIGMNTIMAQCPKCGFESSTKTKQDMVLLDFDLYELLDSNKPLPLIHLLQSRFRSPKISDYKCVKCCNEYNASKTDRIRKMPKALIIVLQRFHTVAGQDKKITTEVTCDTTLDLGPYCLQDMSPPQMRLSSVITHSGNSVDHGHYECIRLIPAPDGGTNFVLLNDSIVQKILPEEAWRKISRNGYILGFETIQGRNPFDVDAPSWSSSPSRAPTAEIIETIAPFGSPNGETETESAKDRFFGNLNQPDVDDADDEETEEEFNEFPRIIDTSNSNIKISPVSAQPDSRYFTFDDGNRNNNHRDTKTRSSRNRRNGLAGFRAGDILKGVVRVFSPTSSSSRQPSGSKRFVALITSKLSPSSSTSNSTTIGGRVRRDDRSPVSCSISNNVDFNEKFAVVQEGGGGRGGGVDMDPFDLDTCPFYESPPRRSTPSVPVEQQDTPTPPSTVPHNLSTQGSSRDSTIQDSPIRRLGRRFRDVVKSPVRRLISPRRALRDRTNTGNDQPGNVVDHDNASSRRRPTTLSTPDVKRIVHTAPSRPTSATPFQHFSSSSSSSSSPWCSFEEEEEDEDEDEVASDHFPSNENNIDSISVISLQPIVRVPDGSILRVDLPTANIEVDINKITRKGDNEISKKKELIAAVKKLRADSIPKEDHISLHDVITTLEGVTQLTAFTEVPAASDEYDLEYAKWMKLKDALNGTALWHTIRGRITDIRNDLNESNLQNDTLLPPAIASIDVQKLENALKSLAKDHGQMDEDDSSAFAKKAKPVVKKWWGNDQGTDYAKGVKTRFMRRFHTDHVASLVSLLRNEKNNWLHNYSGAVGLRQFLNKKKKTIA